jgi:hypothetical protein
LNPTKENKLAFLHCHDCDWEQDDFWSEDGWNPEKSMKGSWEQAFQDKIYMDRDFFIENHIEDKMNKDEKGHWITGPNLLAWNLRTKASQVENMAVRTIEEWKQKKDTFTCPECGGRNLDID